jgi:hypothetical protein
MTSIWIEIEYGGHDMNVITTNPESLRQRGWSEDQLLQAERAGFTSDPEGGLVLCVRASGAPPRPDAATDAPAPAPAPAPAAAATKGRVSGQFVVVVEWGDGTIATNGPYTTEDSARYAAEKLASNLSADLGGAPIEVKDYTYTLGDDSEDQIYVYCQQMGTPIGGENR